MDPRHALAGSAQQRDGIPCACRPGGGVAVCGVACVAGRADQLFGAVPVDGPVGGLAAVSQQQVSAAAQLCGVGGLGADLRPGAVGVGDGVGHLVGNGGRPGVADAGVLGALVDLTGLHDLLLDGLHIGLVDDLLLDGHGLRLRHYVPLNGLHRHGVVAGGHILGQRCTGLGVQRVVGGLTLGIGQGDGGLHTQQRGLVRFFFSIRSVRVGGGGLCGGRLIGDRLNKQRHADILLDHAGLERQRLVRLRCRAWRGGGGRRGRSLGRGGHNGCRARLGGGEGRKACGKCAQTNAGRQRHRRAAGRQLVQRQPHKGAAGEIPHRVLFIKHSCSSQCSSWYGRILRRCFWIKLYIVHHTMKNPPAARGQGEKAAQKNAEIFHE